MSCTCIARPCLLSRSTSASSASWRACSAATKDGTSEYGRGGLSSCTHELMPSHSYQISLSETIPVHAARLWRPPPANTSVRRLLILALATFTRAAAYTYPGAVPLSNMCTAASSG